MSRKPFVVQFLLLCAFTVAGFLVMGYHPGIEDDGVYLAAVKADVSPALFPHDSDFFRLQLQATVFDGWVARLVDFTHIPVSWIELILQFLVLFSILWASCSIAQRLFPRGLARWGGIALLASMFTLPVAGTALYIADQHLHPRSIATALILFAIDRILAGKSWQAAPLLLFALAMHPIMGALGVSFCFFLLLVFHPPARLFRFQSGTTLTLAAPLGWLFQPPSPTWWKALHTRSYYFLYSWEWYEWLGAIGPLILFFLLWRLARQSGNSLLARFALAVVLYGVFQQAVSMVVLGVPGLVRLTPLQPMRYLHLLYMFLVLCAGCLAAEHLLKRSVLRWTIFLLVPAIGMVVPQRVLFSASQHIELPGVESGNPWLQAFAWIRNNTPQSAYFAAGPDYMIAPAEDYHGFRALAERSILADVVKDGAVVTQVPQLGPVWDAQVRAQKGWNHFGLADYQRLKRDFGVDWVLVNYPQAPGLPCPWHNGTLAVCRVP